MKGAGNVTYYNDSYKYNTLYAGKREFLKDDFPAFTFERKNIL